MDADLSMVAKIVFHELELPPHGLIDSENGGR